ncbi:MAG: hypothetical protein ABSC08_00010 [Bryobacteraceae bacterium]|jgi:hypothetical protein
MADLSIPLQGMLRAEAGVNAAASQIAQLSMPVERPVDPQDTVDLSAAMVALAENRVIYAIDAQAAGVLDAMNQSLLSVVG